LPRIEPLPASLHALRAQCPTWQVQTGEVARALRERYQRVLVADIAQIDADAGFAIEQFPQLRHREAVAGMHPDDGRPLVQEWLDSRHKLLSEIFQLRPEPRLHALTGPDQLFAEGREP